MKRILLLAVLFTVSSLSTLSSQETTTKKVELSGIVTDYDNKPIKGARIFVDSLKTKVKTNKKGIYKIMVSPKNKLITVFSAKHGVIDIEYTGQNKINFIFPENNEVISKRDFADLGYGASNYGGDGPDYSNYTDIFQLLRSKFQNVQVTGETIRIRGTGASVSQSGGTYAPLFIVNGVQVNNISNISPSDIKSITVERANTSLYGTRGAGGVIKIKLK